MSATVNGRTIYRVRIAGFDTMAAAKAMAPTVKRQLDLEENLDYGELTPAVALAGNSFPIQQDPETAPVYGCTTCPPCSCRAPSTIINNSKLQAKRVLSAYSVEKSILQ